DGGHLALLATGVDNLTIDGVTMDTNRDGLDIDACRNVSISNTSINAPNDDAIVLKSSYALGYKRDTENVRISNSQVTGYDVGTFLGGTFGRTQQQAPDRDGVTGRIKLGTESTGGFKNIAISNCVFDRSRGLALETVDGGDIEDVTITNVTMRDVTTAPLFLRIGNRGRGPGDPPPGALRRVVVTNLVASGVDPRFASIIAGLPGHPVEDVQLSNVQILYRGGGTAEDAARIAPENETSYPEPSMFGTLPAYGLFVRHARRITLRDVALSFEHDDWRPAVVLQDVDGIRFEGLAARRAPGIPVFSLHDVRDFAVLGSRGLADARRERVEAETLP
ncbi:MAG TPA: glycoside hydrolase family 28 protein, partial [Vicinamibacteria bacterium]|nr:glycoside hydrolase family 28 protein [Vicinamibacteria bacterium]